MMRELFLMSSLSLNDFHLYFMHVCVEIIDITTREYGSLGENQLKKARCQSRIRLKDFSFSLSFASQIQSKENLLYTEGNLHSQSLLFSKVFPFFDGFVSRK